MKLTNIIVPTFLILFATISSMAQNTSLVGEWKLSGYNFVQKRSFPVERMEVTLTIDSSMRVSGRGGCNNYFGTMTLGTGTRINVGPLSSTDMACDEPSNSFEGLFLQTLQDAKTYSISGGQLTLTDPKTRSLIRFRRTGSGPTARKFLFIDNKTTSCPNAPVRKCLRFKQVREDEWQILQSAVTGFKFLPGRFYKIEVRELAVNITNPGESPVTYKFIRVVKSARSERNLYN